MSSFDEKGKGYWEREMSLRDLSKEKGKGGKMSIRYKGDEWKVECRYDVRAYPGCRGRTKDVRYVTLVTLSLARRSCRCSVGSSLVESSYGNGDDELMALRLLCIARGDRSRLPV